MGLTENKYSRLIVIEKSHRGKWNEQFLLCRCNCGNTKIARQSDIVTGKVKSCGCLNKTGRKVYIKKGHNPNSIGRPFNKNSIPWTKQVKGTGIIKVWNKGLGTPGLYSYEFIYKLRNLIRERDGFKCQICGCPQAECNDSLSVHHIDYNKENDDPNNLISLCRSCHMKTTTKREYWKERFSYVS